MAQHFGNINLSANDEDEDDDSDDDSYVPSEHDSCASDVEAGEESSGEGESGNSESEDKEKDEPRKRKADMSSDSPRKKTAAESAAEEKQKADNLWAQFKTAVKYHQEVKKSPEKQPEEAKKEEPKQPSPSENIKQSTSPEMISKTDTKTTTPSSLLIGGPIKAAVPIISGKQQAQPPPINKPAISSPSNSRLGSILSQIGQQKKSKNLLEQTREHWEEFKEAEGISDELALHNRGTKGYLDRQDFLARVDSRQSDQLRQMRLQLMNKRRTT